jgi:anti-sigma-K factor RskA
VLRRLLIAGCVAPRAYRTLVEGWRKAFAEMPTRQQVGAPPVHVTELSRVGRVFPRLVLQSYYQDKITGPQLAEYVNLKASLRAKSPRLIGTARYGPVRRVVW